jgi:hypothetical protein
MATTEHDELVMRTVITLLTSVILMCVTSKVLVLSNSSSGHEVIYNKIIRFGRLLMAYSILVK